MYVRKQPKAGERITQRLDGTLPSVYTEKGVDPITTSQMETFINHGTLPW